MIVADDCRRTGLESVLKELSRRGRTHACVEVEALRTSPASGGTLNKSGNHHDWDLRGSDVQ